MRYVVVALVSVLWLLAGADVAFAQAQIPAGTCTTDPTFNISTNTYLISNIVSNISCILYGAHSTGCSGQGIAEILFNMIAKDTGMINTLRAAVTLYVIIYAIFFTLGMMQITITDFLNRVVKIGIIALLISPEAWAWFYGTVGYFFKEGTDWLIAISSQIAVGAAADPERPFMLVDAAINQAFSAKMFVTLVATIMSGPYGLVMALLLIMSLGTFVAALFQAIWVYLMSLVIRAFLFGLAPIFFPMLLFSRTQHLFYNWLNQLIYTMLAPALLFTFFSFFMVLMSQAMQNILGIIVCYMPGKGLFRGSPMDQVWPRFTVDGAPYSGQWGWNGPVDFPGAAFPIDIVNLVIFLILAQLAWRFNGIALNVAKEIAAASIATGTPQLKDPFGFTDGARPTGLTGGRAPAAVARRGLGGAEGAAGAAAGGAAAPAAGGAKAAVKGSATAATGTRPGSPSSSPAGDD